MPGVILYVWRELRRSPDAKRGQAVWVSEPSLPAQLTPENRRVPNLLAVDRLSRHTLAWRAEPVPRRKAMPSRPGALARPQLIKRKAAPRVAASQLSGPPTHGRKGQVAWVPAAVPCTPVERASRITDP